MAAMAERRAKWAGRFYGATFVLGGIAWLLIAVLLLLNILAGLTPAIYVFGPAPSRIVAGGGAGTWFVMGLLAFLVIGIAGMALSGVFYRYVEEVMGAPLAGWRNGLAWGHLVIGSIGATAASLLMAYGGFYGGAALLDPAVGGGGQTGGWVHTNVLGPLALPIAVLMGLALLGYLLGGVALVSGWMAARKK